MYARIFLKKSNLFSKEYIELIVLLLTHVSLQEQKFGKWKTSS